MTFMLQNLSKTMMASTLALAALALPSFASTCDLTDGFATSPIAFSEEADACLEGLNDVDYDRALERSVLDAVNTQRKDAAASSVEYMESLRTAARLHAMDMAVRGYAAHEDLEGRDHLDRVRTLDRSVLIGASGANIVVLNSKANADAILKALNADKYNRANTVHDGFTHAGIGIAIADGKTYVVELLATVDGRLDKPLPLVAQSETDLSASFSDARMQTVGWRLETADGKILDRGYGSVVTPKLTAGQQAYLTVDVAYRTDEYSLRGPMIVAN